MPERTPAVGMERKLAAIFITDVAGYSRLMGDDEEAAILGGGKTDEDEVENGQRQA